MREMNVMIEVFVCLVLVAIAGAVVYLVRAAHKESQVKKGGEYKEGETRCLDEKK